MAEVVSRSGTGGAKSPMKTRILPVDASRIEFRPLLLNNSSLLEGWSLERLNAPVDMEHLQRAANAIRTTDVPVAFPTETVYGLGADATRSAAVQGIYEAKQRPSDNPLIVHVHSLSQVRRLLQPDIDFPLTADAKHDEVIPRIYLPLIQNFWPGPLTLIMPNHPRSRLAPEVTAGLDTFGVRMPRNPLALALIKLAGVPLAAPSANASTRPSPTTAEHVHNDLQGRISIIIDGGPCEVGLESTVVDGLCSPPAILRPGGISIEKIRSFPGWENVIIGYKDASEASKGPRAPGMKYKHYSPKAPVLLCEYPAPPPSLLEVEARCGKVSSIGLVLSSHWKIWDVIKSLGSDSQDLKSLAGIDSSSEQFFDGAQDPDGAKQLSKNAKVMRQTLIYSRSAQTKICVRSIALGQDSDGVARGLFAALRLLDTKMVDGIIVEGIEECRNDVSIAVMNRLRKAAISVG